jgi:hypothetical protein
MQHAQSLLSRRRVEQLHRTAGNRIEILSRRFPGKPNKS